MSIVGLLAGVASAQISRSTIIATGLVLVVGSWLAKASTSSTMKTYV